MIEWLRGLRGQQVWVEMTILGLADGRMLRYNGKVPLRGRPDVRAALRAASREVGTDLLAPLGAGGGLTVMLDGRRLDFPGDLTTPVSDGAKLSWLSPMAGG